MFGMFDESTKDKIDLKHSRIIRYDESMLDFTYCNKIFID